MKEKKGRLASPKSSPTPGKSQPVKPAPRYPTRRRARKISSSDSGGVPAQFADDAPLDQAQDSPSCDPPQEVLRVMMTKPW